MHVVCMYSLYVLLYCVVCTFFVEGPALLSDGAVGSAEPVSGGVQGFPLHLIESFHTTLSGLPPVAPPAGSPLGPAMEWAGGFFNVGGEGA